VRHFLRYENEQGLQIPGNAIEAVAEVAHLIRDIGPYAIITSAFEGGHCDHDMTNYIVARAAETAGFPRERVFEAAEYSRYYLRDYLLRKINHLVLVRFLLPPRFLPGAEPGFALELSREELSRKRSLFRHFKTQSPERLVKRFGFPDQFRVLRAYDYSMGPFHPAASRRYRFGFWLKEKDRAPFYRGMTLDEYRRIYGEMDRAMKGT